MKSLEVQLKKTQSTNVKRQRQKKLAVILQLDSSWNSEKLRVLRGFLSHSVLEEFNLNIPSQRSCLFLESLSKELTPVFKQLKKLYNEQKLTDEDNLQLQSVKKVIRFWLNLYAQGKKIDEIVTSYNKSFEKRIARSSSSAKKYKLKPGEMTVGELAFLCHVPKRTALGWCTEKGYIEYELRNHLIVITRTACLAFIRAAAFRHIPVQNKTVRRCKFLFSKISDESSFATILNPFGSYEFSENDFRWINFHPEGCTLNELAEQLKDDVEPHVLKYAVQKDRIKGDRQANGHYLIPFEEMIRVFILVRHWVSICEEAPRQNVRSKTAILYAEEGFFGETEIYLNGTLAIRKTEAANLAARCLEIKNTRRKTCLLAENCYLEKGELSPRTFGERIDSSDSEVKFLRSAGYIAGKIRGGHIIFSEEEFEEFVQGVVAGKFPIKSPKIKNRCIKIVNLN